MAQTILLKRRTSDATAPSASDLTTGEVAVNAYSGKLYIKKTDGTVTEVSGSGGGGSSFPAVYNTYKYTATNGQTTFVGNDSNSNLLTYNVGNLIVFLNGVLLVPTTDYVATTGNTVVLQDGATTNDILTIVAFTATIGDGNVAVDTFSGDGSTTAFTLAANPQNENNTQVFIDGIYQSKSNYSVSGTTLTFSTAPPNNTSIEVTTGSREVTQYTATTLSLPNAGMSITGGDLDIPSDSRKIKLGASNDLQIFHDGTNNYIQGGTGDLRIDAKSGERGIVVTPDGATTLYHDNAAKIATASGGVTITGTATATTFVGALTGNVTGNVSGTAATVTGAAQTNITSLGTLTTLTVDDITINGSTISDAGDLTFDIGGDIILDADGGDFNFADGGTTLLTINNAGSNNVSIASQINDGHLLIRGVDNSTAFTALDFDMENAGAATFNAGVTATRFDATTASTTDPVLQLTDDGVADYDFTFPDTSTIQLGTNTTSDKTFKLLNSGSGTFNLSVDGNVGIGTAAPDLTLHVDGTNGYPATSGTTPNGMLTLRDKTGSATHGLYMGVANASPWGSWLQAADSGNLATEYPLLLNPNGGGVVVGGTAVQGGGLLTLEGSDANMLVLHRTADTGDQGILFYDHGDYNATIYGKNGGALEFRTNGNSKLAMHIDSMGSIGIGTTPLAWYTGQALLQLGPQATFHSEVATSTTSQSFHQSLNAQLDTDGSWEYVINNEASNYYQYEGTHNWRVAAAGTAGNDISWTTPMSIDNTGHVGIGAAPDGTYRLKVEDNASQSALFQSATNTNVHIAIGNSSHTQYSNVMAATNTGNYQIWHNGSAYSSFGTGTTSTIIYNSSGDITFNPSGATTPKAVVSAHGLAFNTASPTANNSIHAYQDATAWTPRLFKGTTEVTSPTVRYGFYMQIGDLVWVSFYFYKSSGSLSASGNWRIYGLPFNITPTTNSAYQFIPAGYMTLNGTNEFNEVPYRWQGNSTTYFELYGRRGTTNWTSSTIEMAGSGVINTYP